MPILTCPRFTILRKPEDVARFNVQVETVQPARYVSFGQVFPKGKVPATAFLKAKIGTHTSRPAQMDVETKYDDGTVRFAVITAKIPALEVNTATRARLLTTATPSLAPVDLAAKLAKYNVEVALTGDLAATVNIKMRLLDALADGTATYWLKGPLATQARVDVFLFGSFHIVADVTAYADGTFLTDIQFRNDYSMQETGGTVNYTAKIVQNGVTVFTSAALTHYQYEVWRWVFHSTDLQPTHGVTHNVQHHIGDMAKAGALLNYDTTSGIDSAYIRPVASTNIVPFSPEDFVKYFPMTGGRDDIGPMPAWCGRWVKSQDISAAKVAIANANAAGSIPWHHFDPTTNDYLSLDNYPTLWLDDRSPVKLTQPVVDSNTDTSWWLDTAHTPAPSFIPYLFTGDRYHLDEVNAQATAVMFLTWPWPRQDGKGIAWNGIDQLRGQAWMFRSLHEAMWCNPDGTATKTYWAKIVANNWDNLLNVLVPELTAKAKETAGYFVGDIFEGTNFSCFTQEYVISVLGMAAARGDGRAREALDWAQNWSVGRWAHGWAAAVAYQYYYAGAPNVYHDTWAKIEAANGTSNDLSQIGGVFVPLGLESLAVIYNATGNATALSTYKAVMALKHPDTLVNKYQGDYAQFHIVPVKKFTPLA